MRLSEAVRRLCECGIENARHDAILIFEHFSGIERQRLYFEDVEVHSEELCRAIELRCQRHPLQYIIGEVGFYRESYEVTPDTLIPRQDTEILVDLAVKNIPDGESFVDLCTGSGCIAISVLNNTKNTRAVAVDLSTSAIEVAKRNAIKNGVAKGSENALKNYKVGLVTNPSAINRQGYSVADLLAAENALI